MAPIACAGRRRCRSSGGSSAAARSKWMRARSASKASSSRSPSLGSPRQQRLRRHAEAVEILARQVDAAVRRVVAHVAQHVGELYGDAERLGVGESAGTATAEEAHHEDAHGRRHAVAVASQILEPLQRFRAKIRFHAAQQVEEDLLGQPEAMNRVAEGDPDRMLRLAEVGRRRARLASARSAGHDLHARRDRRRCRRPSGRRRRWRGAPGAAGPAASRTPPRSSSRCAARCARSGRRTPRA